MAIDSNLFNEPVTMVEVPRVHFVNVLPTINGKDFAIQFILLNGETLTLGFSVERARDLIGALERVEAKCNRAAAEPRH